MKFLNWLFGSSRRPSDSGGAAASTWTTSASGNATIVVLGQQLTVFPQDRGWTYSVGDARGRDDDPFYSDSYASKDDAKAAGLAFCRGEPSPVQSLRQDAGDRRRANWLEAIRTRDQDIARMRAALDGPPIEKLTDLRPHERKVASHRKALSWQIAEYRSSGVPVDLIRHAEEVQIPSLLELESRIAQRIAELQAARPRPAPRANSRLLEAEVAAVEDLIAKFDAAEQADGDELDRRRAAARASRRPQENLLPLLDLPEGERQDAMKKADQDLIWQCRTVSKLFDAYQVSGDIPPPHYPMRIAILLKKASDPDRERRFLAAWCRHFPRGNGVKYAQLVERARKAGAL